MPVKDPITIVKTSLNINQYWYRCITSIYLSYDYKKHSLELITCQRYKKHIWSILFDFSISVQKHILYIVKIYNITEIASIKTFIRVSYTCKYYKIQHKNKLSVGSNKVK